MPSEPDIRYIIFTRTGLKLELKNEYHVTNATNITRLNCINLNPNSLFFDFLKFKTGYQLNFCGKQH